MLHRHSHRRLTCSPLLCFQCANLVRGPLKVILICEVAWNAQNYFQIIFYAQVKVVGLLLKAGMTV